MMATGSNIEWTQGDDGAAGATWNPVTGCTRASAGCDNCYAVLMTHRLEAMGQSKYAGLTVLNPRGDRHFNGVVRCHDDALQIPLQWKKPRRIFVNSMSDLFHKDVPLEFVDRVFAVMALTPQHTYQVLTKRPERMAEYLDNRRNIHVYNAAAELINFQWDRMPGDMASTRSSGGKWWPLPNVWLGTSVENQKAADERIPHLLKCQAAVRFLSCEPMIGPVDLTKLILGNGDTADCITGKATDVWKHGGNAIRNWARVQWVIVGGESGPGARRCNLEWIGNIVAECKAFGVPCFVKQLGAKPVQYGACDCGRIEHGRCHANCPSIDPQPVKLKDRKGGDMAEWPEPLRVREFPKVSVRP